MGIIKKRASDQLKHGRLSTMDDHMLYTFAETQLMDAGFYLSRWRETHSPVALDQSILSIRSATDALEELASRG